MTAAFSRILSGLLIGRTLSWERSRFFFHDVFLGKYAPYQIKAVLLLMAAHGETAAELYGALRTLKALEPPQQISLPGLIDTCGTGGDGRHSLNISTLAALVVAGAGGRVAKHGNRAVSSRCGSSDLMEGLGVRLSAPRRRMIQAIRNAGIGYFHAPFYHPVFSRMQPVRAALKTRTLFNLLGPLANPLKLEGQVVGVSRADLVPLYAETLRHVYRDCGRALVCHSKDGLDEISAADLTYTAWIDRGRIRYDSIDPRRYGFKRVERVSYQGGSVSSNCKIALEILTGKRKGLLRHMIIINSAAGLWVSGLARDLRQGIRLAETSLSSGAAYRALQRLKKYSAMS